MSQCIALQCTELLGYKMPKQNNDQNQDILWCDNGYGAKGNTEVTISGIIIEKSVSQNLDVGNMPRFFQHGRILPNLKLWLIPVGLLRYMLFIQKKLYDFHKYFWCSPQLFSIMKKLCKRAMTKGFTFLKFLAFLHDLWLEAPKRVEYT